MDAWGEVPDMLTVVSLDFAIIKPESPIGEWCDVNLYREGVGVNQSALEKLPFEGVLEVETGANPSFAVIWLHGLGADASDFQSLPGALGLTQATRFVFPNAPYLAVTINGGQEARAWYDILQADSTSRVIDVPGLQRTTEGVRALIQREVERGIAQQNIFVAGFSQGGAVAYYTALTQAEPLAGVIALSTYLPAPLLSPNTQSTNRLLAPRNLPIFAAHGSHDLVVSLAFGRQSVAVLEAAGYQPEWSTFAMDHSVSIAEIRALGRWINQQYRDSDSPLSTAAY